MTYATIDLGRSHELDKQFRKDIGELITAYLGDGLPETLAIETLQEEIENLRDEH